MISLFYCCEKLFILMKMWMVGKNLVKHLYVKREEFYNHLSMEHITDADYAHTQKEFLKILK